MSENRDLPRIAIIGGTGEFGRVFARIFKEEGHDVLITGRNQEKGKNVAKTVGVEFSNDNTAAAKKSDVVIVSVSIENTVDVIREIAPHLRPGSLLMDFTSVKVEPVRAMLESAPEEVEVIGTHPMFGPRVVGLEGQTVILTPARGEKWRSFLESFLKRQKAKIHVSTPEAHDKVMAVVQGLTHFAYITTASTIRNVDMNVEETRMYASPVYELMLDFIARIVGQNPRLYASIQMHNPYVGEVHRAFIKEAEKLKELVENKDITGFVKTMTASARIFRDVDSSMGKSDKAISALTSELKRLKDAVGREVGLRHIYSGRVHLGVVVSVDPEQVCLETQGKQIKLKLSNIELLDESALIRWKKEHTALASMDFSFIFPDQVDEKVVAGAVRATGASIQSCEVVDVYQGPQIPKGKKSITLRVESIDKKDIAPVEKLLKGLGGKLR